MQYDDAKATAQGWALFECSERGLEIQRIDDPEDGCAPVFATDDEAENFVESQAAVGDKNAIAALAALDEYHKPTDR